MKDKKCSRQRLHLILGPLLFLLAMWLLPDAFFGREARISLALVCWMAYWWITMPVATAVTGLLPIAVNAVFGLIPMDTILVKYFSETIIILLGADLLTISWGKTGLDKRVSLRALCLIGPSLSQQVLVWFLASALISVLLPNVVVVALMSPIAISMLQYAGQGNVAKSPAAHVILVAIVWGAGFGGLGSPLGGAMNIVTITYLEELVGYEFMYISWVVKFLPIFLLLAAVNIVYLLLIRPKNTDLPGSREYFRSMYCQLPKMSRDEGKSAFFFLTAVALVFFRPLYSRLLPEMKPAYLFLIIAIISLTVSGEDGEKLLPWAQAEKQVIWGLFLMFGGGMAVGTLISETGAAASIADLVSQLSLDGGFLTILILVAFTVLLSEISSNIAAAAISLPVTISIVTGLGLNPIPYVYIVTAAFNSAYVLPTGIRCIPVGHGLPVSYLVRKGIVITLIGILCISIMGWLLLRIWPYFSVV